METIPQEVSIYTKMQQYKDTYMHTYVHTYVNTVNTHEPAVKFIFEKYGGLRSLAD